MTRRYNLKQIPPEEIDFADFNPRGEKPAQIQADPDFEQLKDSVWKYGVLVPVVVHKKDSGKPYRLVDGERRLRAALAANVKKIPAHVAVGDAGPDDLIKAFHIHMLRKQWKPVAQAKALKRIIAEIRSTGGFRKESDLLEEMRLATGYSEQRLKSLRRAIRYPVSVLQDVEAGKLNFSHLVQIEESFIEALNGRFPELLKEVGEKHARDVLVVKAQQKTLTSTRALMENVLPVIARANTDEEKAYAKELIKDFIEKLDMSAEKVLQLYEKKFPSSSSNWATLGKDICEFSDCLGLMLDNVTQNKVKGYPNLTDDVKEHLQSLRAKLSTVLRRISRIEE